jgi:hypothetical protein
MSNEEDDVKCMFLVWVKELDEGFAFKLFDKSDVKEKDNYIAEDFCGNFIEVIDGKIYAYIHDSNPTHILLYKDQQEFHKKIKLLTFDEYQEIVDGFE